jgi:hypothetical protein
MRNLLAFMLVLGLAGSSLAASLGNTQPPKTPGIYPENIPNPALQGGDTFAEATMIPALPYNDSGTTAGYNDDYDEVCPYTGSDSPDVVYSYMPSTDEALSVDLCGSSYDTKLYVYDSSLSLVACNDDFYFDDACGVYVSKLENVQVDGGETYYIIVDGYGGDFGDYVLSVEGFQPCVIECPAGGVAEGEPDLSDGYSDAYNGGCNSPGAGYPFQDIQGDNSGEAVLCGVSGWYLFNGSSYRDTDWFTLTMGASGSIEVTADAEVATYIFELSPQDCDNVGVLQLATAGPCLEAFMTITGYSMGEVVWFWAGPTVFTTPPGADNMYDYVVWFSGLSGNVATEPSSWSTVKALFE